VDDAAAGLERRSQPLHHPVRRADVTGLNKVPFTQNPVHPHSS
jgi:hypothetical protein